MSTIEEIARSLNLDKSTVSRAINGKPGKMSAATRQRILTEAERMGYVPNPVAQALARGRTGNIGFLSRPFFYDLHTYLLPALALAAEEAGVTLITCLTGREIKTPGQPGLLHTGQIDGLITLPHGLSGVDASNSTWRRVPQVHLMPDRTNPEIPSIGFDEANGMYQVADHLWHLGHRWVLFLGGIGRGKELVGTGFRRMAALRAGWRGFGTDPDLHITEIPGLPTASGGFQAVQEALNRGTAFTAVVAFNDAMAQGAIAALYASGRRVPDDVSVVGWNDLGEGNDFTFPPLTSVRVSLQSLTTTAMTLLLRQIEAETEIKAGAKADTKEKRDGKRMEKQTVEPVNLPVTLTQRRSTGPVSAQASRLRG